MLTVCFPREDNETGSLAVPGRSAFQRGLAGQLSRANFRIVRSRKLSEQLDRTGGAVATRKFTLAKLGRGVTNWI